MTIQDYIEEVYYEEIDFRDVPKNVIKDESFLLGLIKIDHQYIYHFENYYTINVDFLLKLLSVNTDLMDYINSHYKSMIEKEMSMKDFYMKALVINGFVLGHIPQKEITYEMCNQASKFDRKDFKWEKGRILKYVPYKFRGKELCLNFVKHYEGEFDCIPNMIINQEFCYEAVQINPSVINVFPEKFITIKLFKEAKKRNPNNINDKVSRYIIKKEYYFNSFKNGVSLQLIPKRYIDKDLILEALKYDGMDIKYVPEKMRNFEVCKAAIKTNENAIVYVPEELKNQLYSEE